MAIIGEDLLPGEPLVGNVMRNMMESKTELKKKGALYVGTEGRISVTPDGGGKPVEIPITRSIAPNGANDDDKVLVADSSKLLGWRIDTCPMAKGLQSNTAQTINGVNWYEFDGTNKIGSISSPTIIRTSEARPKAEVQSGAATVTKEVALLDDLPSASGWQSCGTSRSLTVTKGRYEIIYPGNMNTEGSVYIIEYDGTNNRRVSCYHWTSVQVYEANNNKMFVLFDTVISINEQHQLTIAQTRHTIKNGDVANMTTDTPENQAFDWRKVDDYRAQS